MDTRPDTEVFEEIKTASLSQLDKIEKFLKEEKEIYENKLSNTKAMLKKIETARYESLKE